MYVYQESDKRCGPGGQMELGHVTDAVVDSGRTGQMADLFISSPVHKKSQRYGLQV